MSGWTNDLILRAWEAGSVREGVGRTLAMLTAFFPGRSEHELAHIPLGARDRLLLEIYEERFGPVLRGFTTCPSCSEHLELTLPVRSLLAGEPASGTFDVERGGLNLTLRLPDSADVAAAAFENGVSNGRRVLIDRCILAGERDGTATRPDELSPEEVQFAGEEISRRDPLTCATIDLRCASCGTRSDTLLDVAAFVWMEVSAAARRMLREVHLLASAYGWSERDILGLSAARRRYYLESVMP